MAETIKKDQAYATHFERLADMESYVGKELGLSEWMEMTQDRVNAFADDTEDHQWIHIDPEKAAKYSPYKAPIAHGFLVLSLASKFTAETFSIDNIAMGVNYGLDRVRFTNATKVGASIRARNTLLDYKEIPGGARYKVKLEVEIKGEEKPACIAEFIALAYNGPAKKEDKVIAESAPTKKEAVVLYEKEANVAIITLNRPNRYNAVTTELAQELQAAIARARKDDSIRAIVLTGAGRGFCAGADMSGFGSGDPEDTREYLNTVYAPLIRSILSLRKPIIGAINGSAAGFGASLALACDLRVMGTKSSILYAFINIGLAPDGGGGWLLARQVGYSRALEIAIEGKKIMADHCLDLGLCNKLVEDEALLDKAKEWAHALAKRPTLAVGLTKEGLHFAMNNNFYDSFAYEAEQQAKAIASKDHREGVMAFLDKRKPVFIGK